MRLAVDRVHDLEKLIFMQRDETQTLSKEQCQVELAVRRAAELEEPLEEAKDTIKELKEYAAWPKAELSRIKARDSNISTMEENKTSESSSTAFSDSHRTQAHLPHLDTIVAQDLCLLTFPNSGMTLFPSTFYFQQV